MIAHAFVSARAVPFFGANMRWFVKIEKHRPKGLFRCPIGRDVFVKVRADLGQRRTAVWLRTQPHQGWN